MRSFQELIQSGQLWSPERSLVGRANSEGRIPLGVPQIDSVIGGGLLLGAVHEFLTTARQPPLYILSKILHEAFKVVPGAAKVFWIGVEGLAPGEAFNELLISRSIILTPSSPKEQIWALTRALSSDTPVIVVGSFKNFRFSLTQKFAVISRASKSLCLIIRDLKDLKSPSAAHTRWTIKPFKNPQPAASLELVQNKSGGVTGNWAVNVRDLGVLESGQSDEFVVSSLSLDSEPGRMACKGNEARRMSR